MKTWRLPALLVIGLLLFTAIPSDAEGRHGGGGHPFRDGDHFHGGYLCQSFNAYYPQTPACPEPWVMVPARPY